MLLLIQCFKVFNNTLGWKDPDSREGEGQNVVARAQLPLHIIDQAENKNKTIDKIIKSSVLVSFS